MNWLDKVLMWDELRTRLEAANKAGIELAKENMELVIENIRLRREIESLKGGMNWVDQLMEKGRNNND